MDRPRALVTGASSGIGEAIASRLAAAGYDLVLVARRSDRLAELGGKLAQFGARTEILAVDLSEDEGIHLVADRAAAGDLDVVVSNAGISGYGPFKDVDAHVLKQAWTLNADVTPVLVRAALPGMLERGHGGVITIASGLAFSAGMENPPAPAAHGPRLPDRVLYVAAKAALVGFTRTLALELHGTGVHATVVCPGMVSSEWNSGRSRVPGAMSPDDVATAAWEGHLAGEIVCFPGLEDTGALSDFEAAEKALLLGNAGPSLAKRYITNE